MYRSSHLSPSDLAAECLDLSDQIRAGFFWIGLCVSSVDGGL